MKIKTSYKKTSDCKILVSVRVLDGEDYPTIFIFDSYNDYPSKDGYMLSTRNQSLIECKLDSPEEAVAWAEDQISALKTHLQRWRSIGVPEEAIYVI